MSFKIICSLLFFLCSSVFSLETAPVFSIQYLGIQLQERDFPAGTANSINNQIIQSLQAVKRFKINEHTNVAYHYSIQPEILDTKGTYSVYIETTTNQETPETITKRLVRECRLKSTLRISALQYPSNRIHEVITDIVEGSYSESVPADNSLEFHSIFLDFLVTLFTESAVSQKKREWQSEIEPAILDGAFQDLALNTGPVAVELIKKLKVFQVPTRIIRTDGRHFTINKGNLWDLSLDDEFLFIDHELYETYLRLNSVDRHQSTGETVWGNIEKEMLLPESMKRPLFEISIGYQCKSMGLISDLSAYYTSVIGGNRYLGDLKPSLFHSFAVSVDYFPVRSFPLGIDITCGSPLDGRAINFLEAGLGTGWRFTLERIWLDARMKAGISYAQAGVLSNTVNTDRPVSLTASSLTVNIGPSLRIHYALSRGITITAEGSWLFSPIKTMPTIQEEQTTAENSRILFSSKAEDQWVDASGPSLNISFTLRL